MDHIPAAGSAASPHATIRVWCPRSVWRRCSRA